jgi:hypothetical protein
MRASSGNAKLKMQNAKVVRAAKVDDCEVLGFVGRVRVQKESVRVLITGCWTEVVLIGLSYNIIGGTALCHN